MARRLHLIDIENLACDAFDAHGVAREQLKRVLDVVWRRGDFVTIASNRHLWRRLAWDVAVAHHYIVSPSGRDSADKALLTSAASLDLGTFESVVIGSGDHVFTGLAMAAADQGVQAWVVAARGTIAHSLRQAAHSVYELPPAARLVSRPGNHSAPGRSPAAELLPRRREHMVGSTWSGAHGRRPAITAAAPNTENGAVAPLAAQPATATHAADPKWPRLARPELTQRT